MAKLVKCKTCNKEVAANAKVCPHCGAKNPGIKAKDVLIGFGVLFVLLMFFVMSGDNSKEITKDTFEGKWPFTKDTATIDCFDDGKGTKMPLVIVDGKKYGLTGYANNMLGTYESVNAINQVWLDDERTGLKVDLGDITKAANKLCD